MEIKVTNDMNRVGISNVVYRIVARIKFWLNA